MSDWAQHERRVLVEALRALGPDAPTLCEGWTTADLAAHVYVRERRPDAAPGVVAPGPFAAYTNRVMASTLRVHGYDAVVERIAAGPPAYQRPVDEAMNLFEFLVHAEDVRRANGESPRVLDAAEEQLLWSRLSRTLRLSLRRAKGMQVEVVTPGGDRTVVGRGATVRLLGPPSELVLYAFNRKSAAAVEVTGDADAMQRLAQTRLGV
ncbi:MAG TPA: TIGR03085 family metal-binding protein [Mycobacteriales bacterium]|nr:TIGR03085 family metal-binding protein [Mycobacteriales bacterium]